MGSVVRRAPEAQRPGRGPSLRPLRTGRSVLHGRGLSGSARRARNRHRSAWPASDGAPAFRRTHNLGQPSQGSAAEDYARGRRSQVGSSLCSLPAEYLLEAPGCWRRRWSAYRPVRAGLASSHSRRVGHCLPLQALSVLHSGIGSWVSWLPFRGGGPTMSNVDSDRHRGGGRRRRPGSDPGPDRRCPRLAAAVPSRRRDRPAPPAPGPAAQARPSQQRPDAGARQDRRGRLGGGAREGRPLSPP